MNSQLNKEKRGAAAAGELRGWEGGGVGEGVQLQLACRDEEKFPPLPDL